MKIARSIHKEILRLAGPNILSNISVPLLSSVDTYLMGSLSPLHLGAVGVGGMIFNFIYWNFGFLRMGTTGLTAQAVGQNDRSQILTHLLRASIMSVLLAVLLLLGQNYLSEWSAIAMNVQPEQLDMVSTYFSVRILAAPASLGLYVLMGWLFGMQNAWYPLWITIVANACNILLSYYLVVIEGQGIYGVAMGTVIAQYIALLIAIGLILYKYRSYLTKPDWAEITVFKSWIHFFILNRDIFLRTLCLTLVFGYFYRASSDTDPIVLAVNIILMQLLNWMSYGVDGFAYAAESLTGKYFGAKDNSKYAMTLKGLFLWSAGLALCFSFFYLLLGRELIELFSDYNNEVVEVGMSYLPWMIVLPIIGTPSYIWDGIFVGLTASRALRNSMFISFILFFASVYLFDPLGNHGLWLALLVFLAARGVIQWWMYKRSGWDLK